MKKNERHGFLPLPLLSRSFISSNPAIPSNPAMFEEEEEEGTRVMFITSSLSRSSWYLHLHGISSLRLCSE